MRRLTLLLAGAALWLFLAAIPALADGGPHVSSVNSGSSTLTADSCAGCHRAHTASGPMLLNAPTEEALCLTCHGASSTGATTDVMTGVQYAPATDGTRTGTQLGALRNGGFDQARIDTGNPVRQAYPRNSAGDISQRPKVGVLAVPEPVTSSHIALAENGLVNPGIAWGNGAFSATANPGTPVVALSCANCHNPHGNGNYRILNGIPEAEASGGTFTPAAAVNVFDALNPTNATRNYTNIQVKGTPGTPSTYMLLASDVVAAATAGSFNGIPGVYTALSGDYVRRNVPWTPTVNNPVACDATVYHDTTAGSQPQCATAQDAPNGVASGSTAFNTQLNAWCSTCHSRYLADGNTPVAGNPYSVSSGDAIFTYRHPTRGNRTCNVCHVAHGTNAVMAGTAFSDSQTMPNGVASASSRLLKVDNRGTCQLCHDPTSTIAAGEVLPNPDPVLTVP